MKIQQISQFNNNTSALSLRGESKTRHGNSKVSPLEYGFTNLNHSPISIANRAQISFGMIDTDAGIDFAAPQKSSNRLFEDELCKEYPNAGKLKELVSNPDFDPTQQLSIVGWPKAQPLFALALCRKVDMDSAIVRLMREHPTMNPNLPSYNSEGKEDRVIPMLIANNRWHPHCETYIERICACPELEILQVPRGLSNPNHENMIGFAHSCCADDIKELLNFYQNEGGREISRNVLNARLQAVGGSYSSAANALFEEEMMKSAPDINALSRCIRRKDFDPNKYFETKYTPGHVTPMWALCKYDNQISHLSSIVGELAAHKDFDPNQAIVCNGNQKTFLLEFLLLKEPNLHCQYINLDQILKNSPKVKITDAPCSLSRNGKLDFIKALQTERYSVATTLLEYDQGGGREEAAARQGSTVGIDTGSSEEITQENYSEKNIDQLLAMIASSEFDAAKEQDSNGNLIIHAAALSKDPRAKELFSLAHGKINDIDIKNNEGKTPAMLAVENLKNCQTPQEKRVCYSNIKFIFQLAPNFNAKDNLGRSLNVYVRSLDDPIVSQLAAQAKDM